MEGEEVQVAAVENPLRPELAEHPNDECEVADISSLRNSPDFFFLQIIAAEIPNHVGTPLEILGEAIQESRLENQIQCVLVQQDPNLICCQLSIGNTVITTGKGDTEELAKERAVEYAIEVLRRIHTLPPVEVNLEENNPLPLLANPNLLANSLERQFVLYDYTEFIGHDDPISVLHDSAKACNKALDFQMREFQLLRIKYKCTIILGAGEEIGAGSAKSKHKARIQAAEQALRFLQNTVYTIKIKDGFEGYLRIGRSQLLTAEDPASLFRRIVAREEGELAEPQPLGLDQQGVPYFSIFRVYCFKRGIIELLEFFKRSDLKIDLLFGNDFSEQERKDIYWVAKKLNTFKVSRSGGQVVVVRRWPPMDLLNHLIEMGGSNHRYELQDRSR